MGGGAVWRDVLACHPGCGYCFSAFPPSLERWGRAPRETPAHTLPLRSWAFSGDDAGTNFWSTSLCGLE